MLIAVLALVIGPALAFVGHRTGRLQMRTIGIGLAAFCVVYAVLTLAFG